VAAATSAATGKGNGYDDFGGGGCDDLGGGGLSLRRLASVGPPLAKEEGVAGLGFFFLNIFHDLLLSHEVGLSACMYKIVFLHVVALAVCKSPI
jgi:hypothetical protein